MTARPAAPVAPDFAAAWPATGLPIPEYLERLHALQARINLGRPEDVLAEPPPIPPPPAPPLDRPVACVIVSPTLIAGGIERQSVLLACGLRRAGWEVALINGEPRLAPHKPWLEALAAANVPVFDGLDGNQRGLIESDVVIWTGRALAGATGKGWEHRRGLSVYVVHSQSVWNAAFLAASANDIDVLVAVSGPVARMAERTLGLTTGAVPVIWNGAEAFLPAPRRPWPDETQRFVLGYIGRLSPEKNLVAAIEALKEFDDVDLVLAGEDAGVEQLLRRAADEVGTARVSFLGARHADAVLTGIDALVLPSLVEGCPFVVIEAMTADVPVIAAPHGDLPLWFRGRGDQRFEGPVGPAAIAAAVRQLRRAGAEAVAIEASAAQVFATEYLTAARMVRSYANLIENELAQRLVDANVVEPVADVPPVAVAAPALISHRGSKPHIALTADVRDWAFDINEQDWHETLADYHDYTHLYVREVASWPKLSQFDAVYLALHRWPGIAHLLPRGRVLSSLRSRWFIPEAPGPVNDADVYLVNSFRGFHVVVAQVYAELASRCPNVRYCTNPVSMRRFPRATEVRDRLRACWNGNALHINQKGIDCKGFATVVAACAAANVPLGYAEYHTQRVPYAQMPDWYRSFNVTISMSLYEGACFVEGTPVVLADGTVRPIEQMAAGDRVLTRDGSVQPVTRQWCIGTPAEVVEITTWGGKRFLATREHRWPVWAWLRKCLCGCGGDVRQGHLWIAGHARGRRIRSVKIRASVATSAAYRAIPAGYEPQQRLRSDELRAGDFLLIPRRFASDEGNHSAPERAGAARLLGYYVAEGSLLAGRCGDYGVEFTFGKHERHTWVEDTICLLREQGVQATVKEGDHALRIRTRNPRGWWSRHRDAHQSSVDSATTQLVRWLRACAGCGATTKALSRAVMSWPLDRKRDLVTGMIRGDGHQCWRRCPGNSGAAFAVGYGTASATLARQTQLLLAQLGYPSGIVVVPPRTTTIKTSGCSYQAKAVAFYHVTVNGAAAVALADVIWGETAKGRRRPTPVIKARRPRVLACLIDEDFMYLPIKSVRRVANDKPAYNLTVDGDHSYLVDNIATYNSNSVMEAMAAGHAVICTDTGNHREMRDSQILNLGDTGIVLVERSEAALTAALRHLAACPDHVLEMGRLNRREIAERWSWEVWRERYREFVELAL